MKPRNMRKDLTMNCVFQLSHYQIESVTITPNETFDVSLPAHTGDIQAGITISPHNQDHAKYLLTMDIQIRPASKTEKAFFPYLVGVKGRGFFLFKEPCPNDEAQRTLRLNGASILYGLLRAQVAQITAQSIHGQFLLPAMNFVELAKNHQTPAPETASDASIAERSGTHHPERVREDSPAYSTGQKRKRLPQTKKDKRSS